MARVDEIFVIGFNHTKVELQERNALNINDHFFGKFSDDCADQNVDSLVFLNTCNRSEVYGYGDFGKAESAFRGLLPTGFDSEKIITKSGTTAVQHLFKVASGLDSQLLGDLEILGQFKKAFKKSKEENQLSGYMERLANTCIQSAKEIRSNTQLTSGTTSLSYAAVQLLVENRISTKEKILVIGLGKFGKSIAKNLKVYFPKNDLTITNRTLQKAEEIAKEIDCNILPFDHLVNNINEFDVIISAIDTSTFKLDNTLIDASSKKVLIDLSVPSFFDKELKKEAKINLYTVDDAAQIVNSSLESRKASIPLAENIMLKHVHEFIEWSKIYEKSGSIKQWKSMVESVSATCPHFKILSKDEQSVFLKKSVSRFAKYVKSDYQNCSVENYINLEFKGKCPLQCSPEEQANKKECSTCQHL